MSVDVDKLVGNVERGASWLGEHDSAPPGRFYLWWKMGMTPASPMPGQPAEVREAYGQWYRAYERWRQLYAELERLSGEDAKRILADAIGDTP